MNNPEKIQRSRISVLNVKNYLSEGGFGTVFKGTLDGNKSIAVKILHSPISDWDKFIGNFSKVAQLKHINLVKIIGIVDSSDPNEYPQIVYEFVSRGTLLEFVKKGGLSKGKIAKIGVGIVNGMEYLEMNGIIHKNLSASNVLLDDHLNAKVSDFDMQFTFLEGQGGNYYKAGNNQSISLRPRWMPQEIISFAYNNSFGFVNANNALISSKVDVWSFGCILWEIWAKDIPYGIETSNMNVVKLILEGNNPLKFRPIPQCPSEFKDIMQSIFNFNPMERPKFCDLAEILNEMSFKFDVKEKERDVEKNMKKAEKREEKDVKKVERKEMKDERKSEKKVMKEERKTEKRDAKEQRKPSEKKPFKNDYRGGAGDHRRNFYNNNNNQNQNQRNPNSNPNPNNSVNPNFPEAPPPYDSTQQQFSSNPNYQQHQPQQPGMAYGIAHPPVQQHQGQFGFQNPSQPHPQQQHPFPNQNFQKPAVNFQQLPRNIADLQQLSALNPSSPPLVPPAASTTIYLQQQQPTQTSQNLEKEIRELKQEMDRLKMQQKNKPKKK